MKQLLLVGSVLVLFLLPKVTLAQNTNPNAQDDYVQVCENSGTVSIDVQNNDSDPENNVLTTSINWGPMNGTATVSGTNILYTPSTNFSGNDTIVYVVCDNGSPSLCDTAVVYITVNPQPIADAESDETICFGDSVQIGTPGALNVNYSWSPAAGLSAANVPQPYASPAATSTYVLTVTNTTTGCVNRDTMIITINPVPPANAGPDHTACEGDSVLLGTPGAAGNTYYWSPIPPLDWNSLAQPMAAPSTTTTFTLTVTTTATGCQSKDSVVVTINPAPYTNAGPDVSVCNGDSVQIGTPAMAGMTYSWSPATGLSATNVAQPLASPTVTTVYTLTVTNTTTGCTDTNSVTVFIGVAPIVNAGPDQSACDGDSVLIGPAPLAGTTYSWSPAAGLSASNIAQPMASPAVTTSYTLTATNSFGCVSTDVVVVTVGTSPTADAGADQTICAGNNVQIGTPAVAGNSYSWSPAAGLNSTTVAQPTAGPAATTGYILTVTQTSSGCQSSDTVIVTVDSLPVADAGPDQISCNFDSVQIGSAAVAGMTYSWSPATGLSATNIAQPWAAPLVATAYTLTVTNANGCQNTDVVNVIPGSVPPAIAGPDQSICSGDSVLLGTPAIPGNTYAWAPPTGLSDDSIAQPWASPSLNTNYVLLVTNIVSGCQSMDSVVITVSPLPLADAGPDQVSCDGDSVQIGTPAAGGNTYAWLPPTGLSSTIVAQPMAAPLTTTSYTLTVINTATGCTSTDVVVVTTGTSPVADAGADQTICSGDSVQLGTLAAPGNSYSWSPAAGLSSATVAQPNAMVNVTTTYTLTVTNAAGCTSIDSVTISTNPIPAADAGPAQTTCAGVAVQIGTGAVAGINYNWSPATGLSATNVAQPMASPSVTTTYTLTVTDASTGCSDTATVAVNVSPTPIANAGADQTICEGDNTTIGSAAVAGNTYSWSPATALSSSTAAQPNASPSTTTSYTLTVTGPNGCSASDVVVVNVNPAPSANAGTSGAVCFGDSLSIGAAPAGGNTYSWSPGEGLSSTTVSQPMASPSVTTTYTLTETVGGCSATSIVTVTINGPVANAGADLFSCDGHGNTLGAPAVTGAIYNWSPPDGLSSTTAAQPTATPTATTTYSLMVTDSAGCTSTDEVLFTVSGNGSSSGEVFNAFSPNGDGHNDWWNVALADCHNENEVIIVNRWGNEVWRGKNYNNTDVRWDGKNLDGTDVTDGTYYYIITYDDQELRGWVLVKR